MELRREKRISRKWLICYLLYLTFAISQGGLIESNELDVRLQSRVRQLDNSLESSFKAPENPTSACSCYEVENPFMQGQLVCVCKNICVVAGQLSFLNPVRCDDASEAVPGGPLKHIPCDEKQKFEKAIEQISRESLLRPWLYKPHNWLKARKNVIWRPGLSYFQPLTRDTTNIAHLMGMKDTLNFKRVFTGFSIFHQFYLVKFSLHSKKSIFQKKKSGISSSFSKPPSIFVKFFYQEN